MSVLLSKLYKNEAFKKIKAAASCLSVFGVSSIVKVSREDGYL